MNGKIKITSYSDGELMLREEYKGSFERKGRYLRFEYTDKNAPTHMVVCFDDPGLYRLDSKGERELNITCSDGRGTARLSISGRSIDGKIRNFTSLIKETDNGFSANICYSLSFDPHQWTRTHLLIEGESL